MAEHTIQQEFDRRYKGNKYVPYNRDAGGYRKDYSNGVARDHNSRSPQMPSRMYRPPTRKQLRGPSGLPTEAELDEMLLPPAERERRQQSRLLGEVPGREHLRGIELVNRHRYGDDIDILRATFTKTKEEIEQEKFYLIVSCRKLVNTVHNTLLKVPKHEKYVLGADMRAKAYDLLSISISIKKKFYRKNMLESMDIDLDVLREFYVMANRLYPQWMTDQDLDTGIEACNEVGRIIHGLLASTVV